MKDSYIFFSGSDLEKSFTSNENLWEGFNRDFLLQDAPRTLSAADGGIFYKITRFDGKNFEPFETRDSKYCSWLITEASIAFRISGKREYFESARNWIEAVINTQVWDKATRQENICATVDLSYGNLAYATAFFLDLCGEFCEKGFIERLTCKMKENLELGYERFKARPCSRHPYTQNHFYIPFTGFMCLCKALEPYCSEAERYFNESAEFIPLIIDGLGKDGWYYEGIDYFHYAFIWLVRLSEIAERHLGMSLHDKACFTEVWKFMEYSLFPSGKHYFNVGDNSPKQWNFTCLEEIENWTGPAPDLWIQNYSHLLFWIAKKNNNADCSVTAEALIKRGFRLCEGFWILFWKSENIKKRTAFAASHLFDDYGIFIADKTENGNTLRMLAKCGAPMGRSLPLDRDGKSVYNFNAGHVHPDAGSVFAAWNDIPLIMASGYLGRKSGLYLNSIILNSMGQEDDRIYHAFNPFTLDYGRLKKLSAASQGNGVMMSFAEAYRPEQKVLKMQRFAEALNSTLINISDEIELEKIVVPEARFRVISRPERISDTVLEWKAGAVRMRFELVSASVPVIISVMPGDLITINDNGESGTLECGRINRRGWQISVMTDKAVSSAKWTFAFSVLP